MTQGMFAAVSGVKANLVRLNVIANNIANINTIGFKSSYANFGTVFSTTLSGGSRPSQALGGTNPRQIGVGTQVTEITTNFATGAAQFTGKNTDLFINGNGFFVVEKANAATGLAEGFLLTRSGNFNLDSQGNLVSVPDGQKIRGTSQISGSTPTTTSSVNIPQEFVIVKDLDAAGNILGTHFATYPTTAAQEAQIAAQATAGTDTQDIQSVKLLSFAIGPDGAVSATYSNGDRITVRTNDATINPTDPTAARREIIHIAGEGGTFAASNVTGTDTGQVTQITGFEVFQPPSAGGDGMQGMQLQLQTATVSNAPGLLADTASTFLVGANSGDTFFGIPATDNRGALQAGALEASNVDMASEFSTMIITQRGLEANSKVIRTQDEVLQAVLNIV